MCIHTYSTMKTNMCFCLHIIHSKHTNFIDTRECLCYHLCITLCNGAQLCKCDLIQQNQPNCHILYFENYQFEIFKPLWFVFARG